MLKIIKRVAEVFEPFYTLNLINQGNVQSGIKVNKTTGKKELVVCVRIYSKDIMDIYLSALQQLYKEGISGEIIEEPNTPAASISRSVLQTVAVFYEWYTNWGFLF